MATSTFTKRIVLDQKAAEILAAELNNATPAVRPDKQKYAKMMEESESAWERFLIENFSYQNADVELFLKQKAENFERRNKSRTYLLIDGISGDIAAYFTLSLKSVDFGQSVSKSTIRDIDGFSKDVESAAVVLIGQFGKNYSMRDYISGTDLLEIVLNVIYSVKDIVGGRICLLETEDTPENKKVVNFYMANGFKMLQHDKTDKYLQMFGKL